jgi:hypothetical protein
MNKEFIPYEQALELKELGFNGAECLAVYNINKELETGLFHSNYDIDAPTYSQAFRFFRENYLLLTSIFMYRDMNGYIFNINQICPDGLFVKFKHLELEDTYEEAELACIIKLIEIAKNK